MRHHWFEILCLVLCSASCGMAAEHPVFDRQIERDGRLSRFTLELEQYGVIRKNFADERIQQQFTDFKYTGTVDETEYSEPLPEHDEDGFTRASFRFSIRIDAIDMLTHVRRRTLPQDDLPFAFPRLPSELRLTNAKGREESLTDTASSVYSVDEDRGLLNFRRVILEWCSGFGITRYAVKNASVTEVDLGNGLTECSGLLNLPFMGSGKFRAEIDSTGIVRSVVFMTETPSKESVIHTVTTTGEFLVGSNVIARKGNFERLLPFPSPDGAERNKTEIDDGFTTRVLSMTAELQPKEFANTSDIKEVPANAFVIDMSHGKVKLPIRAGTGPPQNAEGRFWFFTFNLAAVVAFLVYLWRTRRSSANNSRSGEMT